MCGESKCTVQVHNKGKILYAASIYKSLLTKVIEENTFYINYKFSKHDFKRNRDSFTQKSLLINSDTRSKGLLLSRKLKYSSTFMTAMTSSYNNQIFKLTEFKCLLKYHHVLPYKYKYSVQGDSRRIGNVVYRLLTNSTRSILLPTNKLNSESESMKRVY